ncbi:MAG: hypothetical protein E6G41_12385 [Actinobacteria bacterium]|nr:MAG: hypothetical protein E6G41_12385 [Actinomycetota bacterium]
MTATRSAALSRKFVSHRYSFRVTLPEGWSAKDALVAWNGTKLQGLDSGQFANFNDSTTGRALVAAAAQVPKGMRLAQCTSRLRRSLAGRGDDARRRAGSGLDSDMQRWV